MTPQQRFVNWTTAVLGTNEGSTRQRRWARAAGLPYTAAWCATFVAYGLRKMGIKPPVGAPSVASWANWSGGEKVEGGLKNAHPGDLLRFGDQHLAVYIGNGQMISGNDVDNSVGTSAVPSSVGGAPLTEIIRPKQFAQGSSGGGFDLGGALKSGLSAIPEGPAAGATIEGLLNAGGGATEAVGGKAADLAGEVIEKLADLLGINASAIMLNIGLVGGGAFLLYYGIAKATGVDEPVRQFYARAQEGAELAAVAAPK